MNRRDYSIFDNPVRDDPFVKRAGQAKQMIIDAGCTVHMRVFTKGANEFAGSDHQAYIAYVAWKIKAWQVEQAAKAAKRTTKAGK